MKWFAPVWWLIFGVCERIPKETGMGVGEKCTGKQCCHPSALTSCRTKRQRKEKLVLSLGTVFFCLWTWVFWVLRPLTLRLAPAALRVLRQLGVMPPVPLVLRLVQIWAESCPWLLWLSTSRWFRVELFSPHSRANQFCQKIPSHLSPSPEIISFKSKTIYRTCRLTTKITDEGNQRRHKPMKCREITFSWIGRCNIVKMLVLHKMIYRLKAIPTKILVRCLCK